MFGNVGTTKNKPTKKLKWKKTYSKGFKNDSKSINSQRAHLTDFVRCRQISREAAPSKYHTFSLRKKVGSGIHHILLIHAEEVSLLSPTSGQHNSFARRNRTEKQKLAISTIQNLAVFRPTPRNRRNHPEPNARKNLSEQIVEHSQCRQQSPDSFTTTTTTTIRLASKEKRHTHIETKGELFHATGEGRRRMGRSPFPRTPWVLGVGGLRIILLCLEIVCGKR